MINGLLNRVDSDSIQALFGSDSASPIWPKNKAVWTFLLQTFWEVPFDSGKLAIVHDWVGWTSEMGCGDYISWPKKCNITFLVNGNFFLPFLSDFHSFS